MAFSSGRLNFGQRLKRLFTAIVLELGTYRQSEQLLCVHVATACLPLRRRRARVDGCKNAAIASRVTSAGCNILRRAFASSLRFSGSGIRTVIPSSNLTLFFVSQSWSVVNTYFLDSDVWP